MQNRRLSDQVMILEGIASIREELEAAANAGERSIAIQAILIRLSTMYSILDTEQLIRAVKLTDLRDQHERKAA